MAARLRARLADLESARASALQQLPLVRMAQNTDGFLADAMEQAQAGLARWRDDWRQMLGAHGQRGFRANIPMLAEAKLAVLDAVRQAQARLADGRGRRAEAEERMEKVAEAVRRA